MSANDIRYHQLLSATVSLLNKLHGFPMPFMRDEYENAMLAALKLGAVAEGGNLVIRGSDHG